MTATSLPPGPPYSRAVQTLGWVSRPMPFMERCQERYGDMFTLKITNEGTWVFLAHPDLVKQVFTGDPTVFHAGEGNVILLPVVGKNSVLLLDEREHMAQRKLMLPPFHGERMQGYGPLMRGIAEEEISRWPSGTPFELRGRMQDVTLEIIIRAVFGIGVGGDRYRLELFRERLSRLLEASTDPLTLLGLGILGPKRAARNRLFLRELKRVNDPIYEEIALRREDPDLDERTDILSMLLQARHEDTGEPMSDHELRDELMTLLVAGHETTATSLSWALERLVRHPEMLDRLREDVAAGDRAYLDAVVKETLRLRPVLPIVVRRLAQDVQIGDHLLPKGVAVTPCIHLIHRREDVYPEPRRFRPERFLERPAGTYTWIPFGGGVRRCLGASFAEFEMREVLAAIVSRVDLTAAEPRSERVRRRAITLVPEHGTRVVAHPRAGVRQAEPATMAATAA